MEDSRALEPSGGIKVTDQEKSIAVPVQPSWIRSLNKTFLSANAPVETHGLSYTGSSDPSSSSNHHDTRRPSVDECGGLYNRADTADRTSRNRSSQLRLPHLEQVTGSPGGRGRQAGAGIEFDITPSPSEAFDTGLAISSHLRQITEQRQEENSSSRTLTLQLDAETNTVIPASPHLSDRLIRQAGQGTAFQVATEESLKSLEEDVFAMDQDHSEIVEDDRTRHYSSNSTQSDSSSSLAQKLLAKAENHWLFQGEQAKDHNNSSATDKERADRLKHLNIAMPMNL